MQKSRVAIQICRLWFGLLVLSSSLLLLNLTYESADIKNYIKATPTPFLLRRRQGLELQAVPNFY